MQAHTASSPDKRRHAALIDAVPGLCQASFVHRALRFCRDSRDRPCPPPL